MDVRDAAKAHLLAAKSPSANGKRFLIVSEGLWTVEIASFLFDEFGEYYKIKNRKLRFPFVIPLLAPISSRVASLKTRLGPRITCDTTASKEILGL